MIGAGLARRKWILSAGALAIVYLVFGARVSAVGYPGPSQRAKERPNHRRGAWHVHTVRSDGIGTLEEVAAAAKSEGLDFVVVADHNPTAPTPPRYADGVLLIDAAERSAGPGHRVEIGGLRFAAHPLNRRRPYRALDEKALTGMEILSADDLWREALAARQGRLLSTALAYPFAARHALMQIVEWPEATIRRWMELAQERPMVGVCSVDAHGRPGYRDVFAMAQLHVLVDEPPQNDAARDAEAIARALERGRAWCALELLVNGAGFDFGAGDVPMGGEVRLADRPPLSASLRTEPRAAGTSMVLYRGMDEILRIGGTRLDFVPVEPGVYRIEVEVEGPSLLGSRRKTRALFSNPVYVR